MVDKKAKKSIDDWEKQTGCVSLTTRETSNSTWNGEEYDCSCQLQYLKLPSPHQKVFTTRLPHHWITRVTKVTLCSAHPLLFKYAFWRRGFWHSTQHDNTFVWPATHSEYQSIPTIRQSLPCIQAMLDDDSLICPIYIHAKLIASDSQDVRLLFSSQLGKKPVRPFLGSDDW